MLSHVPSLPAVKVFDDRITYYDSTNPQGSVINPNTGMQIRIQSVSALGGFYYRDNEASVVVPSAGGADYDWRVVWPDGSAAYDFWGGGWGSGNPIDGFTPDAYDPNVPNDGVEFGTNIEILKEAPDSSWATVLIWNSRIIPMRRK